MNEEPSGANRILDLVNEVVDQLTSDRDEWRKMYEKAMDERNAARAHLEALLREIAPFKSRLVQSAREQIDVAAEYLEERNA